MSTCPANGIREVIRDHIVIDKRDDEAAMFGLMVAWNIFQKAALGGLLVGEDSVLADAFLHPFYIKDMLDHVI